LLRKEELLSLMDRLIGLFAALRARWLIQRSIWTLEKSLKNETASVKAEVVPGILTLKSFNPEEKSRGWVVDPKVAPGYDPWADKNREGGNEDRPGVKEIVFDFSKWDGEAYFPFWKNVLPVSLTVGATRPTDYQLRCLRELVKPHPCIRPRVDAALFECYQKETNSRTSDSNQDAPLRRISRPHKMRKLVSTPRISIDDKFDDHVLRFTLTFDCDWAECGEVIVTVENWELRLVEE
jgi:hypothetical protein